MAVGFALMTASAPDVLPMTIRNDALLAGFAGFVTGVAWLGWLLTPLVPRRARLGLAVVAAASLVTPLWWWIEILSFRSIGAKALHDASPVWWWLGAGAITAVAWRCFARLTPRVVRTMWLFGFPVAIAIVCLAYAQHEAWRRGRYAVLGTLSQLRAATDQFRLEHGVVRVEFEHVVGPGRYMQSINNDLANYRALFPRGPEDPWSITLNDGRRVEIK